MSTAATVRSISPGSIGYLPAAEDCRIPDGSQVCEIKACENCLKNFLRPLAGKRTRLIKNIALGYDTFACTQPFSIVVIDTGERWCPECRARMLLPPDRSKHDNYLAQLPTGEHEMRFRLNLPRYDDSLITESKQRSGGRNLGKYKQ